MLTRDLGRLLPSSAVLTVLSTLPGVHTNVGFTRVLFGLDSAVVVLFTVEYLLRVRPACSDALLRILALPIAALPDPSARPDPPLLAPAVIDSSPRTPTAGRSSTAGRSPSSASLTCSPSVL